MKLTAQRLREILGDTVLADKLMREVGGHRIPRLTPFHVQRRERDARLLDLLDDDSMPYTTAAGEVGISRSQASRIWRRAHGA